MHDSFQQIQLTQPPIHISIQPLELTSPLRHSGYYMNHPVHKSPQLVPIENHNNWSQILGYVKYTSQIIY
jgi:hypothetical protein